MNSATLVRPRVTTALLGSVLIFLGAWFFGIWGVIFAQLLHSGLFLGWTMSRVFSSNAHPA